MRNILKGHWQKSAQFLLILDKPGVPEKNYTTAIFLTSAAYLNQVRFVPAN